MQTSWAVVGARTKLRSKVKLFNFVSISHLINFVRQRQKTAKIVASDKQTILDAKQTEKKFGPCWFNIFNYFLNIFLQPMRSKKEAR